MTNEPKKPEPWSEDLALVTLCTIALAIIFGAIFGAFVGLKAAWPWLMEAKWRLIIPATPVLMLIATNALYVWDHARYRRQKKELDNGRTATSVN